MQRDRDGLYLRVSHLSFPCFEGDSVAGDGPRVRARSDITDPFSSCSDTRSAGHLVSPERRATPASVQAIPALSPNCLPFVWSIPLATLSQFQTGRREGGRSRERQSWLLQFWRTRDGGFIAFCPKVTRPFDSTSDLEATRHPCRVPESPFFAGGSSENLLRNATTIASEEGDNCLS